MKKQSTQIAAGIVGLIIIIAIVMYARSTPATPQNTITPIITGTEGIKPSTPTTKPKPTKPTNGTITTTPPTPSTDTPSVVALRSLTGKTWHWISTTYNTQAKTTPKDSTRFALAFRADGTFSSTTDCNGVGGKFTLTGSSLTFSEMMSTLMYCEGSQENEYRAIFNQGHTYSILKNGDLRIDLKDNAGYAIFS